MRNSNLKLGSVGAVILVSALVSACDGDSRLFEEAVEVSELDLRSLAISPPAIETGDSIIIAVTQDLPLSLQGTSTDGESAELSATDRSWSSSDTSVATVSDNGVVTGVGTGQATISVSVGSLQADGLTIDVNTSRLVSINSLEPLSGTGDLERCVSTGFFASGLFDDQSLRPLYEVSFDLDNDSDGTVDIVDENIALVSAFNLTPLGVVVSAGEAEPLLSQLTVLDTLQNLTVTSSDTSVDEDETIQLSASGSFLATTGIPVTDADGDTATAGTTRTLDITDGVLWAIASGESIASISNTLGSEGQLLGIAEGTAIAAASCGALASNELTITVNEDSDADELSFNIDRSDGLLVLALNETFQLEVSQGDEFDEDDLVTNDVQFTIVNEGTTSTTISTSSISTGLIVPLTEGAEVDVFATLLNDAGDEILATGSITVRITSF